MNSSQSTPKRTAGRKRTIALLGTWLNYEIPISIFRATRELTQKQNINLLYFSGEAFQSPHFIDSPANIIYNLISPRIADGIIIISNLLGSFASPRDFREWCLRFHPLPVVSMGMAIAGIPSVVLDNTAGMYAAVCHLIEVHHLSRISFLGGPPQHPDIRERFAGFTRAMETHGLPVDKSLLLEGTFETSSGMAAARELLDNRGKIPGKDVQAVVCCNDYMATGVMLELQRREILIPDQIALTGFDDINVSECLIPPLGSVHYPFDSIAAAATEIVMTLMEGKTVPEIVPVRAHFIPRHSCGCPDAPEHTDVLPLSEDLEIPLKNPSVKFPEYLNKQILKIGSPILMAWKQALIHPRLKSHLNLLSGTNNLTNPNPIGSRENVGDSTEKNDQTAWDLLERMVFTTFNTINYQTAIFDINSTLTSTLELSELFNLLTRLLPEVEIERCCFCLYDDPEAHIYKTTIGSQQNAADFAAAYPPWSRLVLYFSQAGSVNLPPAGIRFATSELLPEEITRMQAWNNWVILPLFFKEEQFGYMLIESETSREHLYWSICNQISGTLKGVRLLDETRKANEQKTQFFINVAHETKTPLTLIKNYLSLYMEQHQPDENLALIEQNIDMLLKNMLNFLDVEKLQKGNTIYLHDTLVDLSESAYKKNVLFRELAKKKNISIEVNAEKDILIRIDPWALDRIFNNLLDNAVKYIQPGGRITVEVLRREDKAILRISDNGPGLPVETFDHIFEPYYLLSQKKTSKQGIGVGLSIVKSIIDGLGAGITVEKCREGGVSFTVSFTDSSSARSGEDPHTIPDTEPSRLVSAVIKERNISEEKPALLIVDDNVQLLQFMQTSLEKKYSVFLARDVPEALFKLRIIPRPSLIISDIMMDGADGFTLFEEISGMEGCKDIPFIFLTAMSGEKQRIKGLDLGAVDYIEKPFSISEICAKIDSLIALRKRQEKQDVNYIKNRIQGLFSDVEQKITAPTNPGFDANCKKYRISEREAEILKLLLKGLLYKEIAANLNISMRTVEYNISRIYKKCGVSNKSELITKFLS